MSKQKSGVQSNRENKSYGISLQHESVGVGKSGSDMTEHVKGRKQLQRAHDIAVDGNSVNPDEAEDRKARSKSNKGFLRKI